MSDKSKRRLELIVNMTYVGMICLIVYFVYRYVLGLITPAIVAFVIVSAIHPLIWRLKKIIKTQREVVSFLVLILLYIAIGTGLFFLILNLVFWLRGQFASLSGYYEGSLAPSMAQVWNNLSDFLLQLPEEWRIEIEAVRNTAMQGAQSFVLSLSQKGLSAVSAFTTGIPGFMIAFLFTILLSFFMSMQYETMSEFIATQLPDRARGILRELREIMRVTVLKYLSAYAKLISITFAELSIGLLVLRVPNAILIALSIALFDALPVFGTGAIVLPWAVMEFIKGNFPFAIGLVILYAIVLVVRNIIEPKIVGDKLGLNPIVSLISIYLGFRLIGVFGMILMPIFTQIILELHRRGKLSLFREKKTISSGEGAGE